jgi:hypothetical protein
MNAPVRASPKIIDLSFASARAWAPDSSDHGDEPTLLSVNSSVKGEVKPS